MNMCGDLDLRDFIKIGLNVMELCGYLRPNFQSRLKIVLYYSYAFFMLSILLIMFIISEAINMILIFGDIEQMSAGAFLLLSHLSQSCKIYIFITKCPEIRKLINSVNRVEFRPKNPTQYQILMNDINVAQKMTKFFLLMGFITCVLWGFFPFIDSSNTETRKLPVSAWIPYDTTKSPMYEYAFAYLIIAAAIDGLCNISMDTFLCGMIMIMVGQLKLLNNSFQELGNHFYKNVKISDMEIRKDFIKNILHHKAILEYAGDLTNLFTNGIMIQLMTSVLLICITMFQMSIVSVYSFQFISLTLYQCCALLEIFIWCYFGNEVILESEKLTMSAYMCGWVDTPKEFRKDLLFFIIRSQNSLKFYAGGYFELSLNTYKAILKSSWSYFAVLNSVHNKNI